MNRLASQPLCVCLDELDRPDFVDAIGTAIRAEWANECRKVFVTANLEIVEAMRTKGQVRILSGKEFVNLTERGEVRVTASNASRKAGLPMRHENIMREGDTSDLVSFREFQAFRVEIRGELRKIEARITDSPSRTGKWKTLLSTITVIIFAGAAVVGLYFYTSSPNPNIGIIPKSGI